MKPNLVVDTCGLFCPLPVIKMSDALKVLDPGGVVEVVSDDPAIESDLPAWCESHGHTIESATEAAGIYRYLVRKKADRDK
jgi:TusA-related sulfurtransferase